MVDFTTSETERLIRSAVSDLMEGYPEEYWQEVRNQREVPEGFWKDLGEKGWLGVMIPEEYGGQGMGIQELVVVMDEVARGGGWSVLPYFTTVVSLGANTLSKYGTEEQKREWLPKISRGECQWATAITEPDAGLNTTNISTFAEKDGSEYVISGQKVFISSVAQAARMVVLARSLPAEESEGGLHGFTLLMVDPDDEAVKYRRIPLDIYNPDDVYEVHLDGVRVDESAVVGEEHRGLRQLFDSINVERVTSGMAANGMGREALSKACSYANEREVFGVPIGSHQAIQHPLADAYAALEGSSIVLRKAAWSIENEIEEAAALANIAKLNAGKAAWNAAEAAVSTYGGLGASAEVDITKLWTKIRHYRYSPVSEEMIRNYLAERALGLPRSY